MYYGGIPPPLTCKMNFDTTQLNYFGILHVLIYVNMQHIDTNKNVDMKHVNMILVHVDIDHIHVPGIISSFLSK